MKITVKYRNLGREGALGLAWGYNHGKRWQPSGQIEIDPRQTDEEEMDTAAHEVLHSELPDLSEEAIIRVAGAVTAVLLKLGYGKKK